MKEDDPILNTRVDQAVKDAWALSSQRLKKKPGPRLRELVLRELLAEIAIECVERVGFVETCKRLRQPTYPAHGSDGSRGDVEGTTKTSFYSGHRDPVCKTG